jgi:hypothetical protein
VTFNPLDQILSRWQIPRSSLLWQVARQCQIPPAANMLPIHVWGSEVLTPRKGRPCSQSSPTTSVGHASGSSTNPRRLRWGPARPWTGSADASVGVGQPQRAGTEGRAKIARAFDDAGAGRCRHKKRLRQYRIRQCPTTGRTSWEAYLGYPRQVGLLAVAIRCVKVVLHDGIDLHWHLLVQWSPLIEPASAPSRLELTTGPSRQTLTLSNTMVLAMCKVLSSCHVGSDAQRLTAAKKFACWNPFSMHPKNLILRSSS